MLSFSIAFLFLNQASLALAQSKGFSFIRDAEIEQLLRNFSEPVFKAAGLQSDFISIHIVNNKQLNAFVANGQRLFLFSGLLQRAQSPAQLIGVIAHETGHIAGGHLARTREALENASMKSLISTLIGAAAIIAGGGGAGQAIIGGGQNVAAKSFLKYSRTQESAADQAAISYLDQIGLTSIGTIEFLKIISDQAREYPGVNDSYSRSHPLGAERIAALRNRVEKSPFRDVRASAQTMHLFKRMQAKLYGYTHSLGKTLRKYPLEDQSLYARYARSIAYFRKAGIDKALEEINGLVAEFPNDPYFHELKGQMLFETGKVGAALPSLETAVLLAPGQPLLQTLYATALLETHDPEKIALAADLLKDSIRFDRYSANSWRKLAIAYGKMGDTANLALASAEHSLLRGKKSEALYHAKRAANLFPVGTVGNLRARDILQAAKPRSRK